jgi:uncharacterized protein YhhL (DUF1145 family)
MNTLLKISLLPVYFLAMASVFVTLPYGAGPWLQKLSAILLVIHAVETLLVFKHVRKYNGPLPVSIALSLLFGVLHWMPLAKGKADQP